MSVKASWIKTPCYAGGSWGLVEALFDWLTAMQMSSAKCDRLHDNKHFLCLLTVVFCLHWLCSLIVCSRVCVNIILITAEQILFTLNLIFLVLLTILKGSYCASFKGSYFYSGVVEKVHTLWFSKKHIIFLIRCITAASPFQLCPECSILATEWDISPLSNLRREMQQNVANQSRAGNAEQGSVI